MIEIEALDDDAKIVIKKEKNNHIDSWVSNVRYFWLRRDDDDEYT